MFTVLYVPGFDGKRMDEFIPDTQNITIRAFDKSISKRFPPGVRTENMVSFHSLSLTLNYRFEKI